MNTENDNKTKKGKTWVPAPQEFYADGNRVLGVWLAEGEEVHWQWTHNTDGQSMVTGYTITKQPGKNA